MWRRRTDIVTGIVRITSVRCMLTGSTPDLDLQETSKEIGRFEAECRFSSSTKKTTMFVSFGYGEVLTWDGQAYAQMGVLRGGRSKNTRIVARMSTW